jgi:hypothetical protein
VKEGQLCRLDGAQSDRMGARHGHLWVCTGNPAPARKWEYFTSVATGCVAPFDKSLMEPADET